jgi:hypothetical protein
MKIYIPENRRHEFDALELDPLWKEFKIYYDTLTPFDKWKLLVFARCMTLKNKIKKFL